MPDENENNPAVVDPPEPETAATDAPVLTPAKTTLLQAVEALLHKAGAEIEDDFEALKSHLKAEVSRL